MWAERSKDSIKLSFGEGVALELCHHGSQFYHRAIPADTAKRWGGIISASADMARVAKVITTFVQQEGASNLPWQGGMLKPKVDYVLDQLANTLRNEGVKCCEMRSFPLNSEVHSTPSKPLFSVLLPATKITEQGLSRLDVIVVSEDVMARLDSGNRTCIEGALRMCHSSLRNVTQHQTYWVDRGLVRWRKSKAERGTMNNKVKDTMSTAVDQFVLQMTQGVRAETNLAAWEKLFIEGASEIFQICRQQVFETPTFCSKWQPNVVVTFGDVEFLGYDPGSFAERDSATIKRFVRRETSHEDATAVLITVTTKGYPELSGQEEERMHEQARFQDHDPGQDQFLFALPTLQ